MSGTAGTSDEQARNRVLKARRYVKRRELIGLLLWVGAVGVVYGTLPLPFNIHLLVMFLWLMGSGVTFVGLNRRNLRDTEVVFEDSLDRLEDSLCRISEAHEQLVTQMATYSEARDSFTGEHLVRVKGYAADIARVLGLPEAQCEAIGKAAIAHDLGKIGIPDRVLGKPGKLTEAEFDEMKEHTVIGYRVLGDSPLFDLERQCARHHHERWDGTGYPDGLAGPAIPLVARITSVADVFDALMSKRPYKEPWPREEALQYLRDNAGSHFDPEVVEAFLRSQAAPLTASAASAPLSAVA